MTSLTLVFSNSDTENDFDGSEPGYVIATNVGCKEWSGTITSELDNPHGDTGLKIKQTAEVTYERQKSSPDDSLFYASVKGGGSWSGSGQTSSGGSSCTYSGSGTWDANPTVGYMIMYWGSHPSLASWTPTVTGDRWADRCSTSSMGIAPTAHRRWRTEPWPVGTPARPTWRCRQTA